MAPRAYIFNMQQAGARVGRCDACVMHGKPRRHGRLAASFLAPHLALPPAPACPPAGAEKLALGGSGEACKSAAWQAQNVSACYAPDGSKYYRRGSTNTSIPPPHWLRCARLGVSAAQQTSELEREVQRAQQELAQLELQFQQAQADVAAANAAEVEARRGVAAVKRKRVRACPGAPPWPSREARPAAADIAGPLRCGMRAAVV